MSCRNVCRECDKKVYSSAINFDAAANALLINIPNRRYDNGHKYCIIVTDSIPPTTTINALVFITIEGNTGRYPLVQCNCQQLTACNLSPRTRYATVVRTNTVSGVFQLLDKVGCCQTEVLPSLPAPATATPAPAALSLRTATATKSTKGGN